MLTHLSLFSGIGGIDLAAEWAGFETICFVEIDKPCQERLKKHWPDAPMIGDIRDVTKEKIMAYAQNRKQSKLEEGNNPSNTQERYEPRAGGRSRCRGTSKRTQSRGGATEAIPSTATISPITLITGGFPCQPVSHAGKRRGKEDDRWLWPEMLRVIREVRPAWVVAENVAGLISMEQPNSPAEVEGAAPQEMEDTSSAYLDEVCSDLEEIGYSVQPYTIPACAVGALHRRDRVFIVANYNRPRLSERRGAESTRQEYHSLEHIGQGGGQDAAVAQGNGAEGGGRKPHSGSGRDWWATEPNVGRVAHGVPSRVDRLKGLGNAVVPQQIYPILKAIADIESENGGGD